MNNVVERITENLVAVRNETPPCGRRLLDITFEDILVLAREADKVKVALVTESERSQHLAGEVERFKAHCAAQSETIAGMKAKLDKAEAELRLAQGAKGKVAGEIMLELGRNGRRERKMKTK